ncbi:MAG TPA: hypothetical protein VM452_16240 [Caulifigura sp.]|nr:hypothetical protein [Caulifigura sp.]
MNVVWTTKKAIHFALGTYLLAQLLPALKTQTTAIPGLMATAVSIQSFFEVLPSPGAPLSVVLPSITGGLPNLLVIAAIPLAYWGAVRAAKILGLLATLSALICIATLMGGRDPAAPQIGCFVWILSMVQIALIPQAEPQADSTPGDRDH